MFIGNERRLNQILCISWSVQYKAMDIYKTSAYKSKTNVSMLGVCSYVG